MTEGGRGNISHQMEIELTNNETGIYYHIHNIIMKAALCKPHQMELGNNTSHVIPLM